MQAQPTLTVYVISGATSGIGYGLTERLAARPSTIIYAGARDARKATQLHDLATQYGSHVRIVQLRSESDDDHAAAAQQVEREVGKVDVVVANAGTGDERTLAPCTDVPIDQWRHHLDINTLGPLRLYQHFQPLLARSPKPKYIVISSETASTTNMEAFLILPITCYSVTKCAINHIVRRIHYEQPNLTAFPLQPGTIQTHLGNLVAQKIGLEKAPITLSDGVTGIVKVMDEATRQSHGGRFWNAVDGKQLTW